MNHQIEHDVDIKRTRSELPDTMNFEVDGFAHVRPQSDHCRIEPFEMAHLKQCIAFFRSVDHAISFIESARYGLLDEDVNACFQQPARDLAMGFRGHRETDGVNAADQLAPVPGPFSFSFRADVASGFFVEIADGDKLRSAFGGKGAMDTRVLAAKTADADDCCT